jgi:hypothetical protein
MDGLCDVTGCTRQTYVGWRPLTERLGRKICEHHWRRHRDEIDSFDLFEEFGFKRPERRLTRPVRKEPTRSIPDRVLPQNTPCEQTKPVRNPGCRSCGAERESRHTYCAKCSREQKKQCDRERQKRRYQKRQNSHAFVRKPTDPYHRRVRRSFSTGAWVGPSKWGV